MPRTLTPVQHSALMHLAFDQVCDPTDWKLPIDATVPWLVANVYMDAIEFMVGAQPKYEKIGNMARLTSPGYYVTAG